MSNASVSSQLTVLPSVNFHLWRPCNMRCRFCFATFDDAAHYLAKNPLVTETHQIEVVRTLATAGVRKITFAGGEPTLCPWLPTLIAEAKALNMTTMVISNGFTLTAEAIASYHGLDWFVLSIDSIVPETNEQSGRIGPGGTALGADEYLERASMIRKAGKRFKINTVVSAFNWQEDMSKFVQSVQPERWKIFQALRVEGQNDGQPTSWHVSEDQFHDYVHRHAAACPSLTIVPESNELMTGSYFMVDPAGRVYDNSKGRHTYSDPIHEVGLERALEQTQIYRHRFLERGALYNWT